MMMRCVTSDCRSRCTVTSFHGFEEWKLNTS